MDNIQTPGMGAFSENGNACIIFYSPRIYGTQVLRPYSYQITGNTIDKLACGGVSMKDAISKKDIATHPDVAGAIQPTGNGTPLDMSVMNQMWTFTLMVDIVSPWLGGSAMSQARARRRVIYSGVCLDEPVSPITRWSGAPTYNDGCHLRFCHASEVAIDPGVSPAGNTTRALVRSDMDIVDSSMNKQTNGVDLYVATPDKMLTCTDQSSGITTEGIAALSNQPRGVGIITNLKSPVSHLRQLCMGLDQQISLYESGAGLTVGNPLTDEPNVYDVDQFKSGVASEWSQVSSGANYTVGGIQTGSVISFGSLKQMYPSLNMNTYKQELTPMSDLLSSGGAADQMYTDPKTVYSSMVSAAVSTLAVNFGFDYIDFSYDSTSDQFSSTREGAFQVRDCRLTIQPEDPNAAKTMCANALEMFRRQLIIDLVPTILAAKQGDFQMNVCYSRNGDTVVDLNFYDWPSLSNVGIYEAPNRISSVGSVSLATGQQFIHNGTMLDMLVHNVYGKSIKNNFGFSAFGNDGQGTIIDTMSAEMPMRTF